MPERLSSGEKRGYGRTGIECFATRSGIGKAMRGCALS
jgi:hypothetical protein